MYFFYNRTTTEWVSDVSAKATFPRTDVSEKLTFPRLSETSVSRKRRFRGNISLWKFRMLYLKKINRRTNSPGRKWSKEDKLKFLKLLLELINPTPPDAPHVKIQTLNWSKRGFNVATGFWDYLISGLKFTSLSSGSAYESVTSLKLV